MVIGMNNDIKEILDILKSVSECKEGSRNKLMTLCYTKYKTLLNYITNLQKENERLKTDIRYWEDKWQYTKFSDKDYKQRIDKAVAYINAGKTFDNIDVGKVVNKIQNSLLNILKGSDKE